MRTSPAESPSSSRRTEAPRCGQARRQADARMVSNCRSFQSGWDDGRLADHGLQVAPQKVVRQTEEAGTQVIRGGGIEGQAMRPHLTLPFRRPRSANSAAQAASRSSGVS